MTSTPPCRALAANFWPPGADNRFLIGDKQRQTNTNKENATQLLYVSNDNVVVLTSIDAISAVQPKLLDYKFGVTSFPLLRASFAKAYKT